MKYIEIDKSSDQFFLITLEDILVKIEPYVADYKWSIQLIDAAGNIERVLGMNMVELEKYCDDVSQGYIIDFAKLMKLSKAVEDIIDILIVGCESVEDIPKAYKTENWENICKVIISREDSSLWQLFSQDIKIMQVFKKIIP